jgi:hypothetical protein
MVAAVSAPARSAFLGGRGWSSGIKMAAGNLGFHQLMCLKAPTAEITLLSNADAVTYGIQ